MRQSLSAGNRDNPATTSNPKIITDSSSQGVSKSLVERIANQIAKSDPTIQRVYLSFNPDFYMRMNRFADDINNGQKGVRHDFRKFTDDLFGNR